MSVSIYHLAYIAAYLHSDLHSVLVSVSVQQLSLYSILPAAPGTRQPIGKNPFCPESRNNSHRLRTIENIWKTSGKHLFFEIGHLLFLRPDLIHCPISNLTSYPDVASQIACLLCLFTTSDLKSHVFSRRPKLPRATWSRPNFG